MLQLPPDAGVTVSGPGSVPDANDSDPGAIVPAVNGKETATVAEGPATAPPHPFATTPIVALPAKEGFQLTVAVAPEPLMAPAPFSPVGDKVQV